MVSVLAEGDYSVCLGECKPEFQSYVLDSILFSYPLGALGGILAELKAFIPLGWIAFD